MKKTKWMIPIIAILSMSTAVYAIDTIQGEDIYSLYKPFGVTYDTKTDTLYYNDELVRCFDVVRFFGNTHAISGVKYFNKDGVIDVCAEWDIAQSRYNTGYSIPSVYDKLTWVKVSKKMEFEVRDVSKLEAGLLAEDFAKMMEKYKEFGISCEETEHGRGNLYWNGTPVKKFLDISGEGMTFLASQDGGKINVITLQDEEGKLIGVKELK